MSDFSLGLTSLFIFAFSVYLWIRAIKRVEIPENRIPFIAAWAVAAGMGVMALVGNPGWLGGIAAAIATFGSMFLTFTIAISDQKVGGDAIRVGSPIPEFTALDEHGDTFNSQSLAGHPVLIKFFRGHW